MKTFYSCIDAGLTVPQSVQHLVIRERAQKAGGAVTFYGSEEAKTLASQIFIKAKLEKCRDIFDGVIFFTLHQFRYGQDFNWQLLREILDLGIEVHFAREGLSIASTDDLKEVFPFLMSVDYTLRRDTDKSWITKLESNS